MKKRGLSAAQLKTIAAAAMVIDHTAKAIPGEAMTAGVAWITFFMVFIGRMTMPIMCYFVAEGYYHTHDIRRYLTRMAVFAVIAQLPYYFAHLNAVPTGFWSFVKGNIGGMNVICTLFMGLAALAIAKNKKINLAVRILLCALCVVLTRYCDWRYYGVLWILAFGLFHGSFVHQAIAFVVIGLARIGIAGGGTLNIIISSGIFAALIPLAAYNGEKGRQPKYFFYIFYPAHLLVIKLLKLILL